MLIKSARFNTILCLATALFLVAGCESSKTKKEITVIELHLEVNSDGSGDNETVSIFRRQPMHLNIDKEPFLDSTDLQSAAVVNDAGGFKIELRFNERGTMILNGETQANKDKRIAIYAKYAEKRWLAAPVIHKGITDGVLTFTPDATREESETIVRGLNAAIAALKKSEGF